MMNVYGLAFGRGLGFGLRFLDRSDAELPNLWLCADACRCLCPPMNRIYKVPARQPGQVRCGVTVSAFGHPCDMLETDWSIIQATIDLPQHGWR